VRIRIEKSFFDLSTFQKNTCTLSALKMLITPTSQSYGPYPAAQEFLFLQMRNDGESHGKGNVNSHPLITEI
jgi:hypothetical protein